MDGTCEPTKKADKLSKGFAAGGTNVRREPSPASKRTQKSKK